MNICQTKLVIAFLLFTSIGFGQKSKNAFQFKGSIGVGAFHYYNNNRPNGLAPLGASFTANAVLSYGQFHVPIGISINNQGTAFNHPFNRYGISPQYKWATFHLGWRNMRFSEFTLRGISFFGAGMELNPGRFRMSAMHGKLDYQLRNGTEIKTKRKITAVKIGLGKVRNYFDLIIASGADLNLYEDQFTKPKHNTLLGVDTKFSLLKNIIVLTADAGLSVFTENRNSSDELTNQVRIPRFINNVIQPNNSTHANYAIQSGIAFNFGVFSIKNTYRRIMPEYKSIGINYLRNDLESFLIQPNVKLFKNKIRIAGSVGVERNNLDKLRNFDQNRWISSCNINLLPNRSHNIHLQYSNYSFDQKLEFDSLITNQLVFQQVNNNLGTTYTFNRSGRKYSNVFSLMINLQNTNNLLESSTTRNQVLSMMSNYHISNLLKKTTWNVGITYFDINNEALRLQQGGLNVGFSYTSASHNLNVNSGMLLGFKDRLLNNHISLRYTYKITKSFKVMLSSYFRQNQRADQQSALINRSDLKLLFRF